MATWLILFLVAYVLGVLMFLAAVISEAPKHGSEVGLVHVLVGFMWPFWGLWYLWVRFLEWKNAERV